MTPRTTDTDDFCISPEAKHGVPSDWGRNLPQ